MIPFFGSRTVRTVRAVVSFECELCWHRAKQYVLQERAMGFAFFVPVFVLGTSYLNECSRCAGRTELTVEQATHAVDWAASHDLGHQI